MCDKNHLVRCWFKSHNSSKVHQKSVQSGAAFQAISCQKHGVNIKKSQWMRVFLWKNVHLGSELTIKEAFVA